MKAFENLSPHIREHVKEISKKSSLPQDDETLDSLAEAWLEKERIFTETIAERGMEEVSSFAKDEPKGAIVLTYSGSIVNLGPLVDGIRHCEYHSIGLRTDVPGSAQDDASKLQSDAEVDGLVVFERGPVRKTSPIHKMAVATADLAPEKEEELLTMVTQQVAEEFVEVNKTIIA